MKKDVFAVVMLALIIAVGIYEDVYFDKLITELYNFTCEIETEIQNENKEQSIMLCKSEDKNWEEKNTFIEIVFYNPNIKAVSLDLYEILGALEIEDFKSALARVYVLRKRIDALKETVSFSFESII